MAREFMAYPKVAPSQFGHKQRPGMRVARTCSFSRSRALELASEVSRSGELDVVGLGRAGERARQPEPPQRRLGHALDARRVGRRALRMRVICEAADLDRVLRTAIARDADEVQLQRLAELVQARRDGRLVADAVVRPRRREEPVDAAAAAEAPGRDRAGRNRRRLGLDLLQLVLERLAARAHGGELAGLLRPRADELQLARDE